MAKRKPSGDAIIAATSAALKELGASKVTVDLVAERAGCAKGLIHYHFKTKDALFAATARHIWRERAKAWEQAFRGTPSEAIGATRDLLLEEAASGTVRACLSISQEPGKMTGQAVSESIAELAAAVERGLSGLLERAGLRATIPTGDIARLVSAVVQGLGFQLVTGADPKALEEPYHAFWAAVLSLTQPARR